MNKNKKNSKNSRTLIIHKCSLGNFLNPKNEKKLFSKLVEF